MNRKTQRREPDFDTTNRNPAPSSCLPGPRVATSRAVSLPLLMAQPKARRASANRDTVSDAPVGWIRL
ncbi:MAG: hypothetical protein [Olavius algarvensis Gamma 1 endosymbiont]|nr:MAG: hypothetical protein [Olavius algarvensis Gamma 1 endosymbiont]